MHYPYQLEPARVSDANVLAGMSQRYIEQGLTPSWSAARIGWHIRHADSVVLTARGLGLIQGFAIMRFALDSAHLNLLAVAPAQRRRGIARALLHWLEESAVTAGTFVIALELREGNEAARAFYRSLGYRELLQVPGYYQGMESAIRMTRDLRSACAPLPGSREEIP
jgi:ribosomal protein S18 acetylase RimI-like enzyme